MINVARLVFCLVALNFFGCSAVKNVDKEACLFLYTKDIQDNLVIPILSKNLGEKYRYYNYESPVITMYGKKVKLLFSPTKRINNRLLMYENSFVLVLESCTNRVVNSYIAIAN